VSELTLTVIQLGFLAVLWLFVVTALSVMRTDIFGARAARTKANKAAKAAAARPVSKQPKQPRSQRGTPRKLIVTDGALTGTSLSLTEAGVSVGRSPDSTLVLSDDYASTRHARLFPNNGQWYVEDLGSTNGTYLDRAKVNGPTAVPLGVPIRIGKTVLELRK
jgi:pSer/pThr/pTyr-binding forkhead associated (FHA) protein